MNHELFLGVIGGTIGVLVLAGLLSSVAFVGRFARGAQELRDVTAKLQQAMGERDAELALARARLAENRQLATLGRLAAAVAHEINNPVAVVAANLGYLRDTVAAQPSTAGDGVAAIQDTLDAVDRIAGVVRQLVEAGELVSHGTTTFPVCLASTVSSAVEIARTRVGAAPFVEVDVPSSLHVSSQEASLRQVIASLVTAALGAMRETGCGGGVRISAQRTGECIRLRVEDPAPELDDVLAERRFKPFVDTRPELVRSDVGLSISLALIRMLGAELVLERSDDRGSVVCVELRAAEAPAPAPAAPASGHSPRARLLVVDDDVLTRIGLRRLLGREYVVLEAGSVAEALDVLRGSREPIDAIVCDVVMPDGGAEALMGVLTAEEPERVETMLMLTGGAVDPASGSFLAAHAHRTVRKPVDLATLRAMIDRVRARGGQKRDGLSWRGGE
jgi:signal transduction histidine kinase/CheY-like chemotaxis protein